MTQAASPTTSKPSALISALAALVGTEHVLVSEDQLRFFSADMAAEGDRVACVVQPATVEQLSAVVASATGAGHAVIPRGGGFSYTGGYRPSVGRSVMVDMRRLNRIVEINTEDMYVTVECGCTWRELYEALKAKGVRTPYFGPMSGYWATVGGALSQGSFFLGSSQYGTVAESVLSLEVVLADGSTVRTGSAAGTTHPSPFYRWYGPDLSGLFLSDTGAMGFKARASLRLMPWPEHQRYATFALDTLVGCVGVVSEVGRRGLAAECYSWDPTFVKSVGERSGMLQDVKYLAGVVGSGSSLLRGIKDAARMAMAGKRLFDGSTYLVHVVIDDLCEAGAEERLKLVQAIAARHGAGEVEASVPRANRGTPFADFKNPSFAATGVRNLPTNALVPHSRVQELASTTETFFASRQAEMDAHGITWGNIVFAVGANVMCIEPLIFWTDHHYKWHDRSTERSHLAELAKFDGPTPAALAVARIRADLVEMLTRFGCAHVQIGRSYRWAESREPRTLALLKAVKQLVDPKHLMNPGSLGL